MVYGLIGSAASRIGSQIGRHLVSRTFKEAGRFDRRLHQQVFGRSAGRGFRHGRDAGLAIGSTISSEGPSGLDYGPPFQPSNPPRKFNEARRGRGNYRRSSRGNKRCSCDHCRRFSRFSKSR